MSSEVRVSSLQKPLQTQQLADWHVSMISVGGIIGAGLFVGTSATIAAAGPAVILSYLAAGLLVWIVMLLLGKLALHHEGRGSFISHVATVLGRHSGFVTGWSYAFLWVVTAGAQAVAGGIIIGHLLDVPSTPGALGLVALGLLLNMLPVRIYGLSEGILSIFKLIALALFISAGVFWAMTTPGAEARIHDNMLGHGGFFPLGVWAIPAVVPMIVQTFTGCEIAFVASVDSEDARRNVRRTVMRLPFLILLFYLGSVLVILSLRPWTDIIPGQSPFVLVMHDLHIPGTEGLAIAVTLIAIVSCLNSAKYVVSRVLRELATLGCAPAKLHRSTSSGVPLLAVSITAFTETLIVLSATWSPSRVYAVLLGSSGTIIIFSYFMASLACLHISKRQAGGRKISLLAGLCSAILALLLAVLPVFAQTRLNAGLAYALIAFIGLTGLLFLRRQAVPPTRGLPT